MPGRCQRPACGHPKTGYGREGHYIGSGRKGKWGEGACKAKGCDCTAYVQPPEEAAKPRLGLQPGWTGAPEEGPPVR
ncbi:MAG: hypothetical protein QOD77_882 [Thermoplasmata archaeon]|nr:hypothetical protein [Thermoplasmata archaeon]